jgi:hypothetical protein
LKYSRNMHQFAPSVEKSSSGDTNISSEKRKAASATTGRRSEGKGRRWAYAA